ncbi:MAG: hypothetical protein PHE59_04075 [Patescibacteria group bacterium]|nr:hypothetical protein [Patescibacteria group bacterium]MDD5164075.1 hypothetical protein [Patescibacteria group bacterium]MDD5534841.1 hypothetical protein [Patescibacteria group bacterium]
MNDKRAKLIIRIVAGVIFVLSLILSIISLLSLVTKISGINRTIFSAYIQIFMTSRFMNHFFIDVIGSQFIFIPLYLLFLSLIIGIFGLIASKGLWQYRKWWKVALIILSLFLIILSGKGILWVLLGLGIGIGDSGRYISLKDIFYVLQKFGVLKFFEAVIFFVFFICLFSFNKTIRNVFEKQKTGVAESKNNE